MSQTAEDQRRLIVDQFTRHLEVAPQSVWVSAYDAKCAISLGLSR